MGLYDHKAHYYGLHLQLYKGYQPSSLASLYTTWLVHTETSYLSNSSGYMHAYEYLTMICSVVMCT